MDLTITIKDGKITTKLYEKSLNLYLYIPPHSAHPPGVLNGIIFDQIHCIFTLCSERADISQSVIHHNSPSMILQHNIYQQQQLLPSNNGQIYPHVKFHPDNVSSN
eukprot:11291459-Ditylum_brightwellii.AAC.1